MTMAKPTHEEYIERAKILGQHIAAEMSSIEPMIAHANVALHFVLSGGKCLLCLDRIAKAKDQPQEPREER